MKKLGRVADGGWRLHGPIAARPGPRRAADLTVLADACADDIVVHSQGTRGVATADGIGKAAL